MTKFIGIILASIFSVIVFAQTANADEFASIPLTGPITSPLTSSLIITGEVTYQNIGGFFAHLLRVVPAVGVTVIAETGFFKNHISVSTTTDENGNYVLPVPQKGLYRVHIDDNKGKFFVPFIHVVNVQNHSQTADFKGLKF
jgi:hypothetical protein